MEATVTTPEILILLYSLEALHETKNTDKALEIIKRAIEQLEKAPKPKQEQ